MKFFFQFKFFFLLPCFLISIFFSCKTKQKVVTPAPVRLTENTVDDLMRKIDSSEFNFEWLTAKADVDATFGTEENSFDINLRIRKDSAIWLSITATVLNIEAVRCLITRDTVKAIDPIHKKYFISDFKKLSEMLQGEINFEILQSLASGNFFSYTDEEKLRSVYQDSTTYILSNLRKRKLKRDLEDKDLSIKIIHDIWLDPLTFRIEKMKLDNNKTNRTLIVTYSDFRDVSGKLFPFRSTFDVVSLKPVHMIIQYNKAVANEPQSMPFKIPEKYTRME